MTDRMLCCILLHNVCLGVEICETQEIEEEEGVEIYEKEEIEEEEENRPPLPPMKETIPPPGTPSTPVPAAAGSGDKEVPDPSSAASGLPSSTNSQTEFQESFSPGEVAVWLRRIGLMDRDIKLLLDDGFGTAPVFKLLTVKDLIEMKVSRGGRKLLSQHLVTVAPETVPSCENLSVSAARETIEKENAPDIETLCTSPSNEALLESVDDTRILGVEIYEKEENEKQEVMPGALTEERSRETSNQTFVSCVLF